MIYVIDNRGSLLSMLPPWMIDECLCHWRELAAEWVFENQFFPYIEVYLAEKKGAK